VGVVRYGKWSCFLETLYGGRVSHVLISRSVYAYDATPSYGIASPEGDIPTIKRTTAGDGAPSAHVWGADCERNGRWSQRGVHRSRKSEQCTTRVKKRHIRCLTLLVEQWRCLCKKGEPEDMKTCCLALLEHTARNCLP